MMKKYSWIAALVLALSLAFMGCPEGGGGSGGGNNNNNTSVDWGTEPGMKPTLYGTSQPVWNDEDQTITIKANSSTGFHWTWDELTAAAGESISRDGGNLIVIYQINVKTPAAALTVKNPAAMADNPKDPSTGADIWGQGKGAEYVLGDNTLSNYEASSGKIVAGFYNPANGRGWFEINPLVYPTTSTGIGFVHNFWCDMGGVTAENSEYTLKILRIAPRCCTECEIPITADCLSGDCDGDAACGVTCCLDGELEGEDLEGDFTITPASPEVGDTLTVEYDGAETVTFEYAWSHNGTAIPDADEETYVVPATTAAAGTYTVIITADGYKPKAANTTVTLKTLAGNVTINRSGNELTAAYDGSETGTKVYVWKKNGAVIDDESAATLTASGDGSYTVEISIDGYAAKPSTPVVISSANFEVVGSTLKHTDAGFVGYGWGSTAFTISSDGKTVDIPEQTSGNFAYKYPIGAGTFDIDEWDFVTLNLTTTGTMSNFGYKLYPSDSVDATTAGGRTGELPASSGIATIKLEIRKIHEGLGFQKYSGDANTLQIVLGDVIYSKGTRYTVTLNSDGGTGAPATTYFVDGTVVANHFPTPTKTGQTFLGWKNTGTGNWATDATTVSADEFQNATFQAQWTNTVVVTPITVNFTDNINPVTADSVTVVDTPTPGIGYLFQSNGSQLGTDWATFKVELATGANLVNYDKITFTVAAGSTAYKSVNVYASETDFYNGATGAPGTTSAVRVASGSYNGVPANVSLDINKANAIGLTSGTLYLCIQILMDSNTQNVQVTNVIIKAND
jgi:hypothetical protein